MALAGGAIAGIVIGVVLALLAVGALIWHKRTRRRARRDTLTRRLAAINVEVHGERQAAAASAAPPPVVASTQPAAERRGSAPLSLAPGLPPSIPKSVSSLFDGPPLPSATEKEAERARSFYCEAPVERAASLLNRYLAREESALILQSTWRFVQLRRKVRPGLPRSRRRARRERWRRRGGVRGRGGVRVVAALGLRAGWAAARFVCMAAGRASAALCGRRPHSHALPRPLPLVTLSPSLNCVFPGTPARLVSPAHQADRLRAISVAEEHEAAALLADVEERHESIRHESMRQESMREESLREEPPSPDAPRETVGASGEGGAATAGADAGAGADGSIVAAATAESSGGAAAGSDGADGGDGGGGGDGGDGGGSAAADGVSADGNACGGSRLRMASYFKGVARSADAARGVPGSPGADAAARADATAHAEAVAPQAEAPILAPPTLTRLGSEGPRGMALSDLELRARRKAEEARRAKEIASAARRAAAEARQRAEERLANARARRREGGGMLDVGVMSSPPWRPHGEGGAG